LRLLLSRMPIEEPVTFGVMVMALGSSIPGVHCWVDRVEAARTKNYQNKITVLHLPMLQNKIMRHSLVSSVKIS
jgi:hypothetical protein